jgi:dihydropteroate synthase
MRKTYARPVGLVYGPDARQVITQGRGASLGGLSTIAYTLVELVERDGATVSRRCEPGLLPRQTLLPSFLAAARPLVMGIVNVTPDSFSDGGLNAQAERAIAHGLQMAKEGADILDIGGESTRPGSEGVPEAEELRRILPVIEALAGQGLSVSVDTRKANVMRAALKAGAKIVNDVAALTYEPAAMAAMAEATCPVILMHAQGDPKTMQLSPHYEDVALDVYDWLEARIEACIASGIARERIVADPGIGFGKSFRHNIDVLRQFTLYHSLGVPLLMGLSRKGFIGALTGEKQAGNRVHGSVGGAVWSALNGAHILRVHDVKATVEALAVAEAAADPDQSGL